MKTSILNIVAVAILSVTAILSGIEITRELAITNNKLEMISKALVGDEPAQVVDHRGDAWDKFFAVIREHPDSKVSAIAASNFNPSDRMIVKGEWGQTSFTADGQVGD